MTTKAPNELLGYVTCSRGGRAEVRQTKKAGRHFYTSCACCGLNQGTGQKRQQDIYDNAEFLPGVTVVRPTGVTETVKPVGEPEPAKTAASEPEPKKTDIGGDFDPTASEPKSESLPAPTRWSRFIPGVILIAAAGVGAWMG